MSVLNQTINTSQAFDQWWLQTGQFLNPAPYLTGDQLDLVRRFASSVYAEDFGDFEDRINKLENELEEKENDLTELKDEIREFCEDKDLSAEEKVKEIKESVE